MNKRSQRKLLVVMVVFGVAVAAVLGLTAFEENLLYFYSPSQIKAGEAPDNRKFRVGGLVVAGTVLREEGSLMVQFDLTDNDKVMTVEYTGILPDLFREGQGIVAWANSIMAAHLLLTKCWLNTMKIICHRKWLMH